MRAPIVGFYNPTDYKNLWRPLRREGTGTAGERRTTSMPNLYARQTALTNVGGRIDYISNPARQEHLLAVHDGAADLLDGAYWRTLAQECKATQKHTSADHRGVQGRELVIQLSNALLQRMTPEQIASKLAASFEQQYHRPCIVAIHWNNAKTNLHAHLIYSERDLLEEPEVKVATRALFFDEDGKRCYKKAAILDDAGELRPGCRIVPKGEIYERRCFGSVDQSFSSKAWLHAAKKEWLLPLRNGELRGDVEITEYDPSSGKLPQQHVGKAKDVNSPAALETVARIRKYNKQVRDYNRMVDTGLVHPEVAADIQMKVGKSGDKSRVLYVMLERLMAAMRAIAEKMKEEQGRKKSLLDQISQAKQRADDQQRRENSDGLER